MVILRFILWVLAFFVTLLWISRLVTECVAAMFGQVSEEAAKADGLIRFYLIIIMSILWPIVIIMS